MSNLLAVLLLRVYPTEFRQTYGREALQLIEDRWRDEQGIVRRIRLCFDLGADLVVTQLWARSQPRPHSQAQAASGELFGALARDPMPIGHVLPGMVLALVMVTAFIQVMTPDGVGRLLRALSILF